MRPECNATGYFSRELEQPVLWEVPESCQRLNGLSSASSHQDGALRNDRGKDIDPGTSEGAVRLLFAGALFQR